MKTSLSKGLDAEGKRDVEAAFIAALPFRKQLVSVLEHKIEEKRKKMTKESTYEEPGDWSLKMADQMGYERALREVISLFI